MITVDDLQRIYLKYLDNQESLTEIKYINGIRENIPLISILSNR